MASITFQLSDDLRREFKIKLANEGRSQKEVLLTMVGLYVKGNGDGKGKKDKPGKGSRK